MTLPIKHKYIVCEPLLTDIDFHNRLSGIVKVVAGGESGEQARVCPVRLGITHPFAVPCGGHRVLF